MAITKKPSVATQLKAAKAEIERLTKELEKTKKQKAAVSLAALELLTQVEAGLLQDSFLPSVL